jgi:hypothetical protein
LKPLRCNLFSAYLTIEQLPKELAHTEITKLRHYRISG